MVLTRLLVLLMALVLVPVAPAGAALISTQQEIRIGRQAAAELEAELGVVQDAAQLARLRSIGLRLAQVSQRADLPWTFKIVRSRTVNAISLPGGFIYVTRGMLEFVASDDELAAVLAHEVGHVNQRHHVTLLERHYFLGIVAALIFGGDPNTGQIANFVRFLLTRGFSREFEFEADRVGVNLGHKAGFRADAALRLMERMKAAEGRDPSQFEVLFRTHPALSERVVRVRAQLRGLGYTVWRVRSAPLADALDRRSS